jgi:cell division transport system permease protein
MSRVGYFIARAFAALRETPGMSFVTTLTIMAALVVLGIVFVGFNAVESFTTNWGRVATITAYVRDDVPSESWPSLVERIAAVPGVGRAALVTPDAALDAFKARGAEAAALVEGVSSEVLQAAVEIDVSDDARDLGAVTALATTIGNIGGIDDVDYGRDDHAKFSSLGRVLRFGGGAAALLVALATAFIVSNTIRLAVYARRSEIGILKLVGATNAFVRLPFLLEGAIWGASGGGAAALLLWLAGRAFTSRVSSAIAFVDIRFIGPQLAMAIVALGVMLGVCGAMLAVRRFLDVEPT